MISAPFCQEPFFLYPTRYTFLLGFRQSHEFVGAEGLFRIATWRRVDVVLPRSWTRPIMLKNFGRSIPAHSHYRNALLRDRLWLAGITEEKKSRLRKWGWERLEAGICCYRKRIQTSFTVRVLDLPEGFLDWGFPDRRVPWWCGPGRWVSYGRHRVEYQASQFS